MRFSNLLHDIPSIFDLFPDQCPCYNGLTAITDSVENARYYERPENFEDAISRLDSPFFVLDREMSTHAPYGTSVISTEEEKMAVLEGYWEANKRAIQQLKKDYERGAQKTVRRFRRRIDLLEDAGLLDDTLVISTADHGEYLGEHGLFGHTAPVHEEVVYVPTMFYQTDLDADEENGHITRVGRLLRQSYLDEIPQLWTILIGKMSVVGPRAVWIDEEALLEREAESWRKRWFVKPGLTGLAQVNGVGSTDPDEKLRFDLEYVRKQSFWLDVKIVVRQIWQIERILLNIIGR